MDGGKVLVVDDEPVLVGLFAELFRARGWQVATAESCAAALVAARRVRPQLMVVDLLMTDGTALDVIAALRAELPGMRIVVMTGHATLDTAIEAMRMGARNYVQKPCTVDALIAAGLVEPPHLARVPANASLAQSERMQLDAMVEACAGNISEAARRLGMHRRSLQRKLRKHVPPPS